jgi:hypothetical protein
VSNSKIVSGDAVHQPTWPLLLKIEHMVKSQVLGNNSKAKNRPIRNKNCLWRPCLLMDRDKMTNLYKGPSIDASYQVSVHLAEGFQRRLKCEKLTDDRRRTPSDGKSSLCLWQGELKNKKASPVN